MIYLSGALTSYAPRQVDKEREEQENLRIFAEKVAMLRALGLHVYSPCEDELRGKTWEQYLAKDIKFIYDNRPEKFFFMKGWEKSKGARLEHEIAKNMGAKLIYE